MLNLKMYQAVNYAGGLYLISGIGHAAINGGSTVLFLLESMTESVIENGVKVPKQICKYIDIEELKPVSILIQSNEHYVEQTLKNKGFFNIFGAIDSREFARYVVGVIDHFEAGDKYLSIEGYFKFRDDAEAFESDYDEDFEVALEENPDIGISLRTALDMLAGIGHYD